ncbi:MAG: hypothetical protein H7839_24060 [Magnetococcus sp. YQC-5]
MSVTEGKSTSDSNEACWLVLASADDFAALWVYQQWQSMTSRRILLLTPETLCTAMTWRQHLTTGEHSSQIGLADAIRLQDTAIHGIYNRFFRVMPLHWQRASPEERLYVEQEYMAILLSWMHALRCPILNPPTSRGLSGASRSTAEWRMLAIQAGLPIMPLLMDGLGRAEQNSLYCFKTYKIIMLSNTCYNYLPYHLHIPAQRLCQLADTPLLELHFACPTRDDWLFLHANPWPDLKESKLSILVDVARYLTLIPDNLVGYSQ